MSNNNEGEEVDKLLTLEKAVEGVRKVVEADPGFRYPMQGGEDPRCKCVENDTTDEDYYDINYNYDECSWHFNDDNTCQYTKDGGEGEGVEGACVLGHYFLELGFNDVHRYEAKSPERVLDGHGYEVAPNAVRFLNTIQTSQDHGDAWEEALAGALKEAGYNEQEL